MKKTIMIFVLCLIIICLCSCNKTLSGENIDGNLFVNAGNIEISENGMKGGYEEPRIPDAETAARVAEAYFYCICSPSSVEKYKPFEVAYDSAKKVWKVTETLDDSANVIFLDQTTGEVIMMGYYPN